MNKTFGISVIALLVAAILVPSEAFGGGTKESSLPSSDESKTYVFPSNGKYEPAITMTTVGQIGAGLTFRDNETMENNVHTWWAQDRFGINLKYLWTTTTANNAFITRMRLALSANEQMPDVVAIDNIPLVTDLIDSGKFMKVGDLWEQLASPTYRLAVNQDPSMWYPYTRSDGIYGLPVPENAYNSDTIMFIRTDWLKKFNLDPPKTLAEMEKIMDIFVNQDPDGNGQKDTVGLALNLIYNMKQTEAGAGFIFGAYGDIPGQWNEQPDGTLAYGSVQPSAKRALATIVDWYKKGYIHKESVIHNQEKANALFTSGKAGFIASATWGDRTPLQDVLKNVPDADFRGFRIPAGPEGKAGRISNQNFRGAVLIRKGYANPEAFMLYYNYLWENFAELRNGTEFAYGWKEGYDYVMVNGKPSTNARDFPKEKPRVIAQKFTVTWEGARIPGAGEDGAEKALESLEYVWGGGVPRNGNELKSSTFLDQRRYDGSKVNLMSYELSRQDKFTGAPTPTMKSKLEYLNTDEQETYLKIITGELPVNEFDKFVARWKANGGDQITKEVNDWYNIATGKK
jgi:putative aldouronate transport system substrate-binding protein